MIRKHAKHRRRKRLPYFSWAFSHRWRLSFSISRRAHLLSRSRVPLVACVQSILWGREEGSCTRLFGGSRGQTVRTLVCVRWSSCPAACDGWFHCATCVRSRALVATRIARYASAIRLCAWAAVGVVYVATSAGLAEGVQLRLGLIIVACRCHYACSDVQSVHQRRQNLGISAPPGARFCIRNVYS